jgi:hypothetical protein
MLKNLHYIVNSVQLELDDMTSHRKAKLLQLCVKGWRELQLSALPSVKAVFLKTNEINCINFPDDYEYYTKIGVAMGGQIWTLTRNDNMVLTRRKDECGNDYRDVASGACGCDYGYPFVPFWWNNTYYGGLYGYGGGINSEGYYRIDYDLRRIQFDDRVPQTEILLEYVSNGIEPNGQSVVPGYAINCMIAYVHWQNIMHNRKISLAEKEMKKKEYFDEYSKMIEIINPFNLSEYLDQTYELGGQSPKR